MQIGPLLFPKDDANDNAASVLPDLVPSTAN